MLIHNALDVLLSIKLMVTLLLELMTVMFVLEILQAWTISSTPSMTPMNGLRLLNIVLEENILLLVPTIPTSTFMMSKVDIPALVSAQSTMQLLLALIGLAIAPTSDLFAMDTKSSSSPSLIAVKTATVLQTLRQWNGLPIMSSLAGSLLVSSLKKSVVTTSMVVI